MQFQRGDTVAQGTSRLMYWVTEDGKPVTRDGPLLPTNLMYCL